MPAAPSDVRWSGHGGLGSIVSLDMMMGALAAHLRESPDAEREALACVIFCVLASQDARLVPLAASKYGLPLTP